MIFPKKKIKKKKKQNKHCKNKKVEFFVHSLPFHDDRTPQSKNNNNLLRNLMQNILH